MSVLIRLNCKMIYKWFWNYIKFIPFQHEYEKGNEFSHLMWETQKIRVIKAGTLEKLVESLVTAKGELDSTYVNVFLATYRTFATSKQVLDLLIERSVSFLCERHWFTVDHLWNWRILCICNEVMWGEGQLESGCPSSKLRHWF